MTRFELFPRDPGRKRGPLVVLFIFALAGPALGGSAWAAALILKDLLEQPATLSVAKVFLGPLLFAGFGYVFGGPAALVTGAGAALLRLRKTPPLAYVAACVVLGGLSSTFAPVVLPGLMDKPAPALGAIGAATALVLGLVTRPRELAA